MRFLKQIAATLLLAASVAGILAGAAAIIFLWFSFGSMTSAGVELVAGGERVLEAVDAGLARVAADLESATGAANALSGAALAAGPSLRPDDTSLAAMEKVAGNTLYPRVLAAYDALVPISSLLGSINNTIETADRWSFFDVPPLPDDLPKARDRLRATIVRVEELQAVLGAAGESGIEQPGDFIGKRTDEIVENLAVARQVLDSTQEELAGRKAIVVQSRFAVPRNLRVSAAALTLFLLWFIAGQAALVYLAASYLKRMEANSAAGSQRPVA